MTPDQIYQFFDALFAECKKIGIYSVVEISEEMGVPYKKVKEWASINEDWDYILQICRCHCACHAHHDWAYSEISDKMSLKYSLSMRTSLLNIIKSK